MTFLRRCRQWALLSFLLTACAEESDADLPELHDVAQASATMREAARAVVRIQHPAGVRGTGSFISADGLLLTNAHILGGELCAREGCQVVLSFEHQRGTASTPPRAVIAVPQHVDVGLDMAVLQVFTDAAKTERLATPSFLRFEARTSGDLLGEHVTAIGHPVGQLKKWSSGYVIDAEGEWFSSSVFSLPGSSGSPILNDEGKLVGLLHRGAEGFELLTRTSSQVSAIASASADLQRALEAPLPSSVISLAAPLSADGALARTAVFLAASTWKANVGGQPVSLAWLLGTDCDEALARDDYESIEELQGALGPCFTALDFIECRSDVFEQLRPAPRECPRDAVATWRGRLQAASDKELRFNGSLDLFAVSFLTESLADSQAAGQQTARANILATLDRTAPKLDFTIASYLAAYGIDAYQGQLTRDFVLQYEKVPYYERSASQIASSAFSLNASRSLTKEQTLKIAKGIYKDSKVSIGAKLRVEELLYNVDQL